MNRKIYFVLVVSLFLIMFGISGCTDAVTSSQVPTVLKIWADPNPIPYDEETGGWISKVYVKVEGFKKVTINKLENYVRNSEEEEFALWHTYTDLSNALGAVHPTLSPDEIHSWEIGTIGSSSYYQWKMKIYGTTEDGKELTAEVVITFGPKS